MRKFILAFLVIFSLSSCNWIGVDDTNSQRFEISGTWLLVRGNFYVERHYTHEVEVTDHFANGSTSSLNVDGSDFAIEVLVKDSTEWTFYPQNTVIDEFWLNHDATHPYALNQFTEYQFTVFEYPVGNQQIGGSARPLTILQTTNEYMKIRVQETIGSIDGWNVTYWSILEFEKVASW